jgi:putative transposase
MQRLLSSQTERAADATCCQLLELFRQLLALEGLERPFRSKGRRFYRRVWCPLVTLWYLIWQRLSPEHTLAAVVNDARRGGADALRPGPKALSAQVRSRATTAFAKARARLPLPWLQSVFTTTAVRLAALGPTVPALPVRLLDGSTVRLRPFPKIRKEFPPHRTRRKQSYWCVARVVVGFCAATGVALQAVMGSLHQSEQVLAVRLILEAAARALYVGDRNFGVWRVVRAIAQSGGQGLVRLTHVRARCLAAGRRLQPGLDRVIQWSPSAHDQVDRGLKKEAVVGRLVVVRVSRRGYRTQVLCLFTTLTDRRAYPPAELVRLYGGRWQVELDFRTVKATMALDQLEVQSADLARKEFYAGLLAYNLVRGLMALAGRTAGCAPSHLSFAAARTALVSVLSVFWLGWVPAARRTEQLEWLCGEVGRARLPQRKKPRPSEPRAQWHEPQVFPPMRGTRAQARRQLKKTQQKS